MVSKTFPFPSYSAKGALIVQFKKNAVSFVCNRDMSKKIVKKKSHPVND